MGIPGWLIGIIIELLIKVGWPQLIKLFPWIPVDWKDALMKAVKEFLEKLGDPNHSNSVAKKQLRLEVKRICSGVACQTEIKK